MRKKGTNSLFNMEKSVQQYKQAVRVIKEAILHSQYRAAKLVTGEQLSLYFGIGAYVSLMRVCQNSLILKKSQSPDFHKPGLCYV